MPPYRTIPSNEEPKILLDFPRINILAMAKSLTEPEFKQYNTNELLDTKS
jgi:hypothetical protein